MLVKIEAWILIFPGTDILFPSTSVPPGTFLGSGYLLAQCDVLTISDMSQSYSGQRSLLLLVLQQFVIQFKLMEMLFTTSSLPSVL